MLPQRSLSGLLVQLVCLAMVGLITLWPRPPAAVASLSDDRYDGNIYALYAGNGSLVPPRSTLGQALSDQRVAVLIYYLDDSAVSKRFAPVVSELQRLWGNGIELIPLVTDPLQNRPDAGPTDPAHYWGGSIPQVVIIDGDGRVVFDAVGQVTLESINDALARATGRAPLGGARAGRAESLNELNLEVRPIP